MNIEISARHFELTDALKTHVEARIEGFDKFYNGIDDVHVILEVTGGMNNAHIQMLGNRLNINAKAKSHDVYNAFDESCLNLERQIRKFKDKRHSHPHRNSQAENSNFLSKLPGRIFIPAENSEFGSVTVSEPINQLPRFTTTEAILEFELSGSDHLVFFNSETDKVSAVYGSVAGNSQVVELVPK